MTDNVISNSQTALDRRECGESEGQVEGIDEIAQGEGSGEADKENITNQMTNRTAELRSVKQKLAKDDGEHVLLAISYSKSHFGAATYDQLTATCQLLHDTSETPDFRMIKSLIIQVRPTIILAFRNQDLSLLRWLARNFSDQHMELDGTDALGESSTLPTEKAAADQTTSAQRVGVKRRRIDERATFDSDRIVDRSGESLAPFVRRQLSLDEVVVEERGQERNPEEFEEYGQEGDDQSDEEMEDNIDDQNGDRNSEASDIDDPDERMPKPKLVVVASSCYKYERAVARIHELFEGEEADDKLRLLTRFRIDLDSRNMVRAFGALLRYMDATRVSVQDEPLIVRTPIKTIRTMSIEQLLEIDRNTFIALDIFATNRKHESSYRRILNGDTRNTTLWGLINRCKSTPGKAMLRHWFEHPILCRETLRKRQKAVAFFTHDCYADITSNIFSKIGKVKSVRSILKRFRSGTASVQHWKNLYDTIYFLVTIGRILNENNVHLELLADIGNVFTEQLAEMAVILGTVIDFSESKIENRLVVNEGIDAELDETKRIYANLPGILTGIAMEEAKRLRTPSCSIGYVPLVGYLTALPLDYPIESMPELEVIYATENSVQVKSARMTELDEELGDVKLQVIDKETTIMLRMQKEVLSIAGVIRGAMRAAACLDAVISLALSAREFGWRCPELTDEPVIQAKNAEHPLARVFVKKHKFVGNHISFGGSATKVKIFTGPNSCGKTVYLKMVGFKFGKNRRKNAIFLVGLITFLAHIGSFVPAETSRIGPVDKIMSRLYTLDDVLGAMSTFAIDLNQISIALRRSTGNSLVIIDEFGKGTMTEVGLSLLASTLSYWIGKGKVNCPHILSSTHFHAIANHIPNDEEIVSFHTFESREVGGRMRFLYKLQSGIVDCSFAVHTAREAGIDEGIIARATEVYTALKEGKSLTEIEINESEEEKAMNKALTEGMETILNEFLMIDIAGEEGEEKLMELIKSALFIEEVRIDANENEADGRDLQD